MHTSAPFLIGIVVSFLITLVSTPIIRKLAFKVNFVDRPNPNNPGKIHKKETALLGGLAVLVGVFPTVFILGGFKSEIISIVLLASFMFIIGLIDDKKNLDYRFRLLTEFAIVVIFTTVVLGLDKPGSIYNVLGFVLAVLWIVSIANAVNMMDNIDGATAGVTSLAAVILLIIAIYHRNYLPGILASALLGSLLAFLIYNYNPASIFLGDAGTLSIGCLLASTAVIESKDSLPSFFPGGLAFPFILGFPIYDAIFATIRRLALKKPVYIGGGSNLTYRLLFNKISKQKVVLIEYGFQVFFCLIALFILWGNIYVCSVAVLLGIIVPLIIGRLLF